MGAMKRLIGERQFEYMCDCICWACVCDVKEAIAEMLVIDVATGVIEDIGYENGTLGTARDALVSLIEEVCDSIGDESNEEN